MPGTFPCPNPNCKAIFASDAVKGATHLKCPQCGTVFQFRADASKPCGPTSQPPAPPAPPAARPPTPAQATAARPPAPPRPAAAPIKPQPPAMPAASPNHRAAPSAPVPAAAPPLPRSIPVAPPLPVPAPTVPVAAPVDFSTPSADAAPSGLEFDSPTLPKAGNRRRGRRRAQRGWLKPVVLLFVLGAIGGGLWFGYKHLKETGGFDGDDTSARAKAGGYSFKIPSNPWKQDTKVQTGLEINPAFRRGNSTTAIGLLYKDYERRLPTEAEMVSEALGRLRKYFNPIEWEMKPGAETEPFGGQQAKVMVFAGERDNVVYAGECTMLAHRGFGYWFFAFSPEDQADALAKEAQQLKAGFTLDPSMRDGWQSRPRDAETVRGEKIPYRLAAFKDVWTKQSTEGADPLAELVLEGSMDRKDKIAAKKSAFQAVVLPRSAGAKAAVDAAVKHVLDREKTAVEKAISEQIADKKTGATTKDLAVKGLTLHRTRLALRLEEDAPYKYVDLAAVPLVGGTLVLIGECPWDKRDYWEQEFGALFNSLQVTEEKPTKAKPKEPDPEPKPDSEG